MSQQLKSLSLSELRDALDKRQISTSTGSLKGEQRKQELLSRLEQALEAEKVPQRPSFTFLPSVDEDQEKKNQLNDDEDEGNEETDTVGPLRKDYTLQEIRHELEKRKLPTTTPMLKGEARRYALIQRLMNYHESNRSRVQRTKAQTVEEEVEERSIGLGLGYGAGAMTSRSSLSGFDDQDEEQIEQDRDNEIGDANEDDEVINRQQSLGSIGDDYQQEVEQAEETVPDKKSMSNLLALHEENWEVGSNTSSVYSNAREFYFFDLDPTPSSASNLTAARRSEVSTPQPSKDPKATATTTTRVAPPPRQPQAPSLPLSSQGTTASKPDRHSSTPSVSVVGTSFVPVSTMGEKIPTLSILPTPSGECTEVLHQKIRALRGQLLEIQTQRHKNVEKQLIASGFPTLDQLSHQVEKLHQEKKKLLNTTTVGSIPSSSSSSSTVGLPPAPMGEGTRLKRHNSCQLIRTNSSLFLLQPPPPAAPVNTIVSENGVDLMAEDVLQMIEKNLDHLKRQIELTKQAYGQLKEMDVQNDVTTRQKETQLLTEIATIEQEIVHKIYESSTSNSSLTRSMSSSSVIDTARDHSLEGLTPRTTSSTPIIPNTPNTPSTSSSNTPSTPNTPPATPLLSSCSSFRLIQKDRVPIYSNGMKRTFSKADVLGNKAYYFQQTQKDLTDTHRVYTQAIELEPCHPVNLGNYALFLYLQCQQYEEAEEFFLRALEADPLNVSNLSNYANFLKRIRKEYKRAEEYYLKALEVDAQDVSNLGNYANFLRHCKHNQEIACFYFEKALSLCPTQLNNLAQYASLLTDMKRFDKADQIYRQVLDQLTTQQNQEDNNTTASIYDSDMDTSSSSRSSSSSSKLPHTTTTTPLLKKAYMIGNYANLCRKSGRFQEAKALYLQALEMDPDNELITRNL